MIIRFLVFELILVVVVAGVWFLAPLVGITSAFWRIMIILALVIPPIVLIIWNYFSARKASSGLEKALKQQGQAQEDDVRPDRREEIQVLNDNFAKEIGTLKKSKLGRGRTALYAMPWYMVIGPPAVGKSTALLRSGLKFPHSGDKKSIKGVGGTRNCDWWFSDQAILLDTAGRYTSEEEDLDEWIAFLRLLRKYRKKRPLNGLLVAVSVSDLLTAQPAELEDQATKIRSRIDQVIEELGLALPVYVLLTKCDLIQGFVEFFGDMTKSTRSQVFGFTVPLTTPQTDIEQLFNKEFDLLVGRLRERLLHRLANAKSHQRGEVFKFPLQLAAARELLCAFITQLMSGNPYMESPRLRGVYFCSGTQEGKPVDAVMGMMSRAFGLRELSQEGFNEKTSKKSYFLRDVFTEVMFPDRDLAGMTATGRSRQKKIGIAAVIASLLLSVTIVGISAITYGTNSKLISSSVTVAKKSRLTTPEDPRKVLDSLRALDRLGEQMVKLTRYKADGAPWSLSFGFYRGDSLEEPVEKIYVKRMRQAFVLLAGTELEATLVDIANATDSRTAGAASDFKLLKTYLMVNLPQKRLEKKFATPILIKQWKKRLHPDVAQEEELLQRNVERYLVLLKQGRAGWLEQDKQLVANVRHALRARDSEYRSLIGKKKLMRPFTLRDALRGRVQTLVRAKHSVPGIYTRLGWKKHIGPRLRKQMISSSEIEPWVLGEEENTNMAKRLKDRYYEQYIISWRKFIGGLSVNEPTSAAKSLALLEKLTEHPPIYQEIFTAIAYNTELPLVDGKGIDTRKASRLIRGKAGRALRKAQRLGLDKAAGKALSKRDLNEVERTYLPLRELVNPPPGIDGRPQISGLRQYLSQLEIIRDRLAKELEGAPVGEDTSARAIEEAQRITRGILVTLPGDLRRIVQPLFLVPLEATSVRAREAGSDRAAVSFSSDLCTQFSRDLAGRVPFSRRGQDAILQDVVAFFAPSGTVWNYYEENHNAQILRRGNTFKMSSSSHLPRHIVDFYNRAWRITRAVFPKGSDAAGLRFQVRPYQAVLASGEMSQVSEIVLEVEGKEKVYRNGPLEQWAFEWTGQDKPSRIMVRGAGKLHFEIKERGEWSLLRLIKRGAVKKSGSWYRVEWKFKGGQIRIPMDFRPARQFNVLFSPMKLSCK